MSSETDAGGDREGSTFDCPFCDETTSLRGARGHLQFGSKHGLSAEEAERVVRDVQEGPTAGEILTERDDLPGGAVDPDAEPVGPMSEYV